MDVNVQYIRDCCVDVNVQYIRDCCVDATYSAYRRHSSPVHMSTLQSAGTLSPDISWMTSPGTSSSARMLDVMPPRIALHLISNMISCNMEVRRNACNITYRIIKSGISVMMIMITMIAELNSSLCESESEVTQTNHHTAQSVPQHSISSYIICYIITQHKVP